VILAVCVAGLIFVKNSKYFKLERIDVIGQSAAPRIDAKDFMKIYRGRNIFDIDIRSLASQIESSRPVIETVVVRRMLPNRLEIDITERIPVAAIENRGEFAYVDKKGMTIAMAPKNDKLPVISGIPTWPKLRVGEKIKSKELGMVFSLMEALDASNFTIKHEVSRIDVSKDENLSFYIENNIEVKIGNEDFAARLNKLWASLENPDLDKKNIRYIDLRFKGIVIGPK